MNLNMNINNMYFQTTDTKGMLFIVQPYINFAINVELNKPYSE